MVFMGCQAFAVAAGLGLALAVSAQETKQSLPDAAAKEKERRKAVAAARTYREADLYRAGASRDDVAAAAATESPSPSDSPQPAAGKREKTDDEVRAEKRTAFEKQIAGQVKTMAVVRKAMDDAQLELNDTTTITQFGTRKEALQKVLDDGLAELKKAEAAIASIEEDARRQGVAVSRP